MAEVPSSRAQRYSPSPVTRALVEYQVLRGPVVGHRSGLSLRVPITVALRALLGGLGAQQVAPSAPGADSRTAPPRRLLA